MTAATMTRPEAPAQPKKQHSKGSDRRTRNDEQPKIRNPRKGSKARKRTPQPSHPSIAAHQTVTAWLGLNDEMRREFELMVLAEAERRGWTDIAKTTVAHNLLVVSYARALSEGSSFAPVLAAASRAIVADVFMRFCDNRWLTYDVIDANS